MMQPPYLELAVGILADANDHRSVGAKEVLADQLAFSNLLNELGFGLFSGRLHAELLLDGL